MLIKILVHVKTGKRRSRVVMCRVGESVFEVREGDNLVDVIIKFNLEKYIGSVNYNLKASLVDFYKNLFNSGINKIVLDIESNKRPINGEVNTDIINILSKFFKVSKSQIELLSGFKSRQKAFQIII